jgi:hypothetical protein
MADSKLKDQIAELQIAVGRVRDGASSLHELAARTSARTLQPDGDWLERALNAERRLECLVRLAAAVMPPHDGEGGSSYRPPSAWRALAREIARAKRHLSRARQRPDAEN